MIIMKFGGISLENTQKIQNVCRIIHSQLINKPILVFSAIGKTTDNLIHVGALSLSADTDKITTAFSIIKKTHEDILKELDAKPTSDITRLFKELEELLIGIRMLKELSPRTKDHLVSFGERLSVRVMSIALEKFGITNRYFDAWDVGMRTNSNFTSAEILEDTYHNIKIFFHEHESKYTYTPIITGFIGKDEYNNITTLGRGGSDLTATIIGVAINATEIQIWKDVDGIMTTDPKIVPNALPLTELSYEDATELAYFGAKVLHPRSILPAMIKNISVIVKNSNAPNALGTRIIRNISNKESNKSQIYTKNYVRAIACKRHITMVEIVSTRMLGQYGYLAEVFRIFSDLHISVDMIATSEVSISLTIDNTDKINQLIEKLSNIATVNTKDSKSIVSIICNINYSSIILNKIFDTLQNASIHVDMISQGASKINIGLLIDEKDTENAIIALHKTLCE